MDALNESCAVASARRQFLVGLGTSVTTTLLAGCTSDNGSNANGPKTTPDEIPKGGTLEVTAAADPQNLDPHTTTIDVAQMVLDNVVEGLFTLDENLKLEPVLATDYKLRDNETTYDIALKENVTFHDGSEFTSADVKYSIERILDPDVPRPRCWFTTRGDSSKRDASAAFPTTTS
ncbi:ABC transporter substrate-binding protein [Haladaptatus pallidirubidus]|nr:ABC transporter substrate-binding protein [Haladaptatus pallidirubidus]